MTHGEKRRTRLMALAGAAAVLAGVAFVTVSIDAQSMRPPIAQGPVVPDLARDLPRAQRVRVTTRDGAYVLEKIAQGWAMRDRGDYPVNAARLSQLTQGLSSLAFTRRMTSDPNKYGRLGVDDPRQGGAGVLVQVEDGQGALLVNLILGVETTGLYVRRPSEPQVWAARGDLPPLREPAQWLDIRPLRIDPATLTRVEIVPNPGRAYILDRQDAAQGGAFTLTTPERFAGSVAAPVANAAAAALARVQPIDVQPAPAIQGPPSARIRAHTSDGAMIDAQIVFREGAPWLKLTASPERPDGEAAALAINRASSAWAYRLSPADAQALTPPLAGIPTPPPGSAPASAAPATTPPAVHPPASTPQTPPTP